MKISIIIPTYKPDYYIWECLDSIKEQTLDKELFEVLIILNGEKEPYYNNILNYIRKNDLLNFKIVYTEKPGVSNARNIGLDICVGEYIAFIDDDDLIEKNYLEELLKNINEKRDKRGIILSNYINFNDKNGEIIKKSNYKLSTYTIDLIKFRQCFSVVWGKLIPKNVINNNRFSLKYKNGEDSLFMVEISKNIQYIETIKKESIYRRRIRENSATTKKKSYMYIIKNSFFLILDHFKFLLDREYDKRFVLIRILAIIKGSLEDLKFW